MTDVSTSVGVLSCYNCATCGIAYGMPTAYDDKRREDGRAFYCPNGHSQVYTDSTSKQLKAERDRAARLTARLDQERSAREHAERRAAAARGQVTKMRNRVGRGVCPCCNRSFSDLAAHMQTKHPDFAGKADAAV